MSERINVMVPWLGQEEADAGEAVPGQRLGPRRAGDGVGEAAPRHAAADDDPHALSENRGKLSVGYEIGTINRRNFKCTIKYYEAIRD